MSTKNKIVLKKHGIEGQMIHEESSLIFKSSKEKIVIGRINDDGEFVNFDRMCLNLCNKFNFKKIKEDVEEDEEVEEVEETEETEDVEEVEETEDVEEVEEVEEVEKTEKTEEVEKTVKTVKTVKTKDISIDTFKQTIRNNIEQVVSSILDFADALSSENDKLKKDLENLQNRHLVLSNKFNAIKSLFN